jgi:hypothetical protein
VIHEGVDAPNSKPAPSYRDQAREHVHIILIGLESKIKESETAEDESVLTHCLGLRESKVSHHFLKIQHRIYTREAIRVRKHFRQH